MRGLLVLVVLLVVPGAVACKVTPILEVDLDVPKCHLQGAEACDPVPGLGQERVYEGAVRWYWDVDQCTLQAGMLQDEMRVTFSGVANNPAWLAMRIEPETIAVPLHEYYDPTYVRTEGDRIYSAKEAAFQTTFEAVRAPTVEEAKRVEQRNGMAVVFLKAVAEGEGTRATFAVEQAAFDARGIAPAVDDVPSQQAPLPWLPVTLMLVAFAAWRQPSMRR